MSPNKDKFASSSMMRTELRILESKLKIIVYIANFSVNKNGTYFHWFLPLVLHLAILYQKIIFKTYPKKSEEMWQRLGFDMRSVWVHGECIIFSIVVFEI